MCEREYDKSVAEHRSHERQSIVHVGGRATQPLINGTERLSEEVVHP